MSHICLSHLSVKSWGGYSPARPRAIALRAAWSAAPPHPKKGEQNARKYRIRDYSYNGCHRC